MKDESGRSPELHPSSFILHPCSAPSQSPPKRPRRRYRGLSIGSAFLIALESLARNKTRAFLATLGIVIGVGCVITMMALGAGASEQMADRIRRMGSNMLTIRPGEIRQGAVRLGRDTSQKLILEDAEALGNAGGAIQRVSPRVSGSVRVKWMNQNTKTSVMGVTSDYFPIRNFRIAEGRAFLAGEIESRARVCLLGAQTASDLFGNHDPLGERVQIKGQPFLVIGVLEARGGSDADWDDRVWAPVTTVLERVLGQRYLERIEVQAVDEESMDAAQEQIETLLRRMHHLRDDEPSDFEVRNQQDLLDMVNETSQVLSYLLAGIASVSLLVGGIGIMNIMLVSVIERTREIGIRRAIGARRYDILLQFLIESLVMCGMGAALGILAGLGACWIGAVYAEWPIQILPASLLIASGFAVGIGVFFGLYPALRAARLSPLAALRYQ
jgi:putative ABC transport system permease protein